MAKKFFLLTGDPGVGKTTIIMKLNSILNEKGISTSGFYTEEVRKNRVREGFDVVSLDGERGRLARDSALLTGAVKYNVGRYGVLVEEFENIALPSIKQKNGLDSQVLIIDEIGKMEFFSSSFKSRVKEIFNSNSTTLVLATIPSRKSDALIESIRNHIQAKTWVVTRENRNNLHEDIFKELNSLINIK